MKHPPQPSAEPNALVRFQFDGRLYQGKPSQPLAVALLAAGVRGLRRDSLHGETRGAFCFMGICQECVVLVEGRRVESCRLRIHDGLVAERAE